MKLHVFVATTQGLVAIQNITAIDDIDISSIVSVNGTSTTANISNAYHNFVKNGAGIIQHDFGACSYRINVSKRIDQGNSWQLAFYLAHAANKENILGDGQVKSGDKVICATGELNTSSRNIQSISDIRLKQVHAATQIKHWHKSNIEVCFLVPQANAKDVDKNLPLNIKFVNKLSQALSYLPLTSSAKEKNKEPVSERKLSFESATETSSLLYKIINVKAISIIIASFLMLFFLTNHWINDEKRRQAEPLKNNINTSTNKLWQVLLVTQPSYQINDTLKPAFTLIEKTIAEQLIADNFDVADKALLVGSEHILEQTLFQLPKDGINLAIRFNLTVHKLKQQHKIINNSTSTWRYELSAKLIDLENKRQIETHTEFGEYTNNTTNCDNVCYSQWHAANARKLAQDMGAILVVKLNNLPRRYQLELTFRNFLSKELDLIHQQLNSVPGALSSKLLQEFDAKTVMLHQVKSRKYQYQTNLTAEDLMIELQKIFKAFDLSVNDVKRDSHAIEFTRSNMPYSLYYIASIMTFCAFMLLLIIAKRRRIVTSAHYNEKSKLTTTLNKHHSIVSPSNDHETFDKKNIAIKGPARGQGALENYYIFNENTLEVARNSNDATSSFAIDYQQISRLGQQCLFKYENNNFYVQDQGSTNGTVFNGVRLAHHQLALINKDCQLILGGGDVEEIALCQLDITLAQRNDAKTPDALIMHLNSTMHPFIELESTSITWPSIEHNLRCHWVLMKGKVSLSISNKKIVLGDGKSEILAYLVYQDGFYLEPVKSINSQVMVNQKFIFETMPICENSLISLNGLEFSMKSLSK